MGDAVMIPIWIHAVLAGAAGFAGIWLAAQLDGVRVGATMSALTTVILVGLAIFLVPGPASALDVGWSIVLITGLTALAAVDARTRTVPDLVSVPMIALGLAHAAMQGGLLVVFTISAAVIVMLGMLMGRILAKGPGWMGSGDVLLLAGAVAWFGPAMLPDLLLISAIALIAEVVVLRLVRRPIGPDLPLAPALGLAQIVIWLGGPLF